MLQLQLHVDMFDFSLFLLLRFIFVDVTEHEFTVFIHLICVLPPTVFLEFVFHIHESESSTDPRRVQGKSS